MANTGATCSMKAIADKLLYSSAPPVMCTCNTRLRALPRNNNQCAAVTNRIAISQSAHHDYNVPCLTCSPKRRSLTTCLQLWRCSFANPGYPLQQLTKHAPTAPHVDGLCNQQKAHLLCYIHNSSVHVSNVLCNAAFWPNARGSAGRQML